MASLNRTFALAEMNRRAERIGKDLEFDVARFAQIPLEQHRIVTERRECFALRRRQRFVELLDDVDDAHAASAAAGARLDQQRESRRARLRCAIVAGD